MLDTEILDPSIAAAEQFESEPQPEKRNCGRTGPTSSEGRAASSKNAVKHGACSRTLVLAIESEESWLILLRHWTDIYRPAEDSLEYDFVLKTAQAEWHRIRNQRNYDSFICTTQGISTFNWTPDQIKKHDLALRYKTSAERSFQREYRLLEQHYKLRRPTASDKLAAKRAAADKPALSDPAIQFRVEDPDSPNGYRVLEEYFGGRQVFGPLVAKETMLAEQAQAHTGRPEAMLAQQAPTARPEAMLAQQAPTARPETMLAEEAPETRSTHDPPGTEKKCGTLC